MKYIILFYLSITISFVSSSNASEYQIWLKESETPEICEVKQDYAFNKYFKDYPFVEVPLVKNCRNPIEIIKETNKIAGTELITKVDGYSEPTKHIKIKNDDKEKHAKALVEAMCNTWINI
mgnify:CR=1 FL=1